jgi:hypothetical protein
MDPQQICTVIAQAFWLLLGAGCSLLGVTWQLFRTRKYLREALERERLSSTAREKRLINEFCRTFNSRQQSLLESFLREPTPTLHDLVERTEREFRARASAPSSEGSGESTIQIRTSDFTPR